MVELIDRAEAAGLVSRAGDVEDHRVVRVDLTPVGQRRIAELSRLHLEELRRLAPMLGALEAEAPAGGQARSRVRENCCRAPVFADSANWRP